MTHSRQVEDSTWTHFNTIADGYDDLYGFMHAYIADFTVEHLQLRPDDHLIDVGAGTGSTASLIWQKAGLCHPVLCIEPGAEMLQVAEKRNGVETHLATGDQFFAECKPQKTYNKILISQVAHFFPDPQETFRKAFNFLPVGGIMAIVAHSSECTLPLWKAIQEKFSPKHAYNFEEFMENAGFKVTSVVEVGKAKMTKRDWYDKLRGRMFSTLDVISDEEIEEGLRELDEKWFPGKRDTDIIEVRDQLILYIAKK